MNTRLVDPEPTHVGRPVTRRSALSLVAGVGAALATTGLVQSCVFAGQQQQGEVMNQSSTISGDPTIVLIHGGFADASSWNGVIDRLQVAG